jgi:hypothetical protein
MKKLILSIAFCIPFVSQAQDCSKNPALAEPVLVPTANDTMMYDRFVNRHTEIQLPPFELSSLAYTRGFTDTMLLLGRKTPPVPMSLNNLIITSPLIVEGVITQIKDADTAAGSKNMFYARTYTIQVKNVVKSKYKIAAGEKIMVKSSLNGYHRNARTGEVKFSTFRFVEFYEVGKPYLFVLDKYEYMKTTSKIKAEDPNLAGYYDEYCPTAFSFVPGTIGISKEYASKSFTIDQLKQYLSKK